MIQWCTPFSWIKPKTAFYLCLDVTQKCDLQISMKSSFFMKYSNTLMSLDNIMIPWNTVTFFMMSKWNQGKIVGKHCFVRWLLLIIQPNYLFVLQFDSKWAFRFIQYFLSSLFLFFIVRVAKQYESMIYLRVLKTYCVL